MPDKVRPKKLFIKGKLPDSNSLYLGVVGSRTPTAYGREVTEKIIGALGGTNTIIVSGLAVGIDTRAHKAALKNNLPTIGVLGSGLDESVLYPQENIQLAREIAKQNGALLSEYKSDEKAERWTFPERNRIIAGIAHAVLVIEAKERSGALITAECAVEYNRDVLAVPGSIFSAKSAGANNLIKRGAIPITSPGDIRKVLGFEETSNISKGNFSDSEQNILELLSEELNFDDMMERSNLSREVLLTTLSSLELQGAVRKIGSSWRKN